MAQSPMELLECPRFRKLYGIRRSSCLCCFLLGFYVLYLFMGSAIISSLEWSAEENFRNQNKFKEKLTQFLMEHPCISSKELNELLAVAIEANQNGITFKGGNISFPDTKTDANWTFSEALFFTVTILTTIGYGRVTPRTTYGKIFCVIYLLIGIPMTLTLGTALVQRIMIPILIFERYLHRRLNHSMTPFKIKMLHFLICSSFLLIFLLFLPAYVFSSIEPNWNYLDGLYYCFITLTTVGLGDYIPGDVPNQNYRLLYKLFSTGYLFFSVLCVLVIVTMFNDIPELNFGVYFDLDSDIEGDISERTRINLRLSMRNYRSASSNDLVSYNHRHITQKSLPESVEP